MVLGEQVHGGRPAKQQASGCQKGGVQVIAARHSDFRFCEYSLNQRTPRTSESTPLSGLIVMISTDGYLGLHGAHTRECAVYDSSK